MTEQIVSPYDVISAYGNPEVFEGARDEGYQQVSVGNGMTRHGIRISGLFDFYDPLSGIHKVCYIQGDNGKAFVMEQSNPMRNLTYTYIYEVF